MRSISLSQGISLYVGAVIGAGVLILPGLAASMAGPASVVAWGFDSLLGIPLALTFASLAGRYPDAGGVATYTARAFGSYWGAVVGWFYFIASATGQILVTLTGAYYAASALGIGRQGVFLLAAIMLMLVTLLNVRGMRVSGRWQLALSGGVVCMLLGATLLAAPRMALSHWRPFAPHGLTAVGQAGVLIFFAFFGWEAIAQLSAEFTNPARDVLRSTLWSVVIVTIIYAGISVAIVGTGTYGSLELDRVAVARLLSDALGVGAGTVVAFMALLIALGTSNAFLAATSRLGYALARDGAFPRWMATLSEQGVPVRAVLAVAGYAIAGLAVTDLLGWGAEHLLVIPNSLGIATYVIGTAAGVKLMSGKDRWLSLISFVLCLAVLPFAGGSVVLPAVVALAAWCYLRTRRDQPITTNGQIQSTVRSG